MKTNKVLSAVLIVLTALALASCTGKKFHVSGVITDAKDSLLYFENMSLNGPVTTGDCRLCETRQGRIILL